MLDKENLKRECKYEGNWYYNNMGDTVNWPGYKTISVEYLVAIQLLGMLYAFKLC